MGYVETFFEEKDIDLEQTFTVDGASGPNTMPYGVVVDAIKATTGNERKAIEATLRKIDFENGSVKHYLRHLGAALAI